MTRTHCDQCGVMIVGTTLVVSGYVPTHQAGILLPESLQRHEFCSAECLERWLGVIEEPT